MMEGNIYEEEASSELQHTGDCLININCNNDLSLAGIEPQYTG
jgi:hypothetical protein